MTPIGAMKQRQPSRPPRLPRPLRPLRRRPRRATRRWRPPTRCARRRPRKPSFALPAPDPLAVELPTAYPADATYADELPAAHPAPDLTPPAALPSSVPELAQAAPSFAADLEARQIAERLKSRMTRYLTGEGRGLIEARCRDALHDHAGWLVGQIAREVALALETEVAGWVTEEVGAALARRNAPARSDTTQ
ncbi:conserved hypothetical protein [Burkholderia pseudomallei 1106a]|uniref:DUF2486 family protein n=1 Tax=Burkholderia pseudomallei (strain 1106a) TaxID=357348 RepID=A3NSI3_BURP0|nr:conserved hypothetical protein [Burkholderia pseudomallei 1106a]